MLRLIGWFAILVWILILIGCVGALLNWLGLL